MRRLKLILLVSFLLATLAFVQKGNVLVANASSSIFQGDLILNGNNVTIIENERFDINGSIIVEENATLVLKNAMVNFTQTYQYQYNMTFRNPANGKPRLQAENSMVASDFYVFVVFYGNSSAIVSNSDAQYLRLFESAVATVTDSSIFWLEAHDSSVASVFNSTIEGSLYATTYSVVSVSNSTIKCLAIQSDSVNCSIANVGSRFYDFWDYRLNTSLIAAPAGHAPNVTIRNTAIDWWQFNLWGSSNATITDSTITYLTSYDYTVVRLINSTALVIQYYLEGRIYASWYLDVHLVDSVGQDVPSANVTAKYPNATIAQAASTDAYGRGRFTLMEKMMNATGSYPVGNYTVQASYSVYSNYTTVNITQSQEITLALSDFVIPEFPLFLMPLFTIATLLAVILHQKKKERT